MLFAWTFSAVVDWLQGDPGGPTVESAREDLRRRARPRPRSIPWRPVDGDDPGELFETGWPDQVYVLQPVFPQIRRHVPERPGEQRYGFLLGRRLECPATGDPYLLIDEIWAAPDPLRERGGTEEFEKALEAARGKAAEGEKDVLGWFHTHSPLLGLQLSEHDVRLHARFFPEPWHCALIEVVHGEKPLGGLFQRRQKHCYPGTKLISFLEVAEGSGFRDWGDMESQLDWTNYETPRSGIRRAAPPREPAPMIRASRGTRRAGAGDEEPVDGQPTAGPSWNWLPLGRPDATEAAPTARPRPAERPAAERPATGRPATGRPVTERPATERPAIERPATERPAIGRRATGRPAIQRPAIQRPAVERPAAEPPERSAAQRMAGSRDAAAIEGPEPPARPGPESAPPPASGTRRAAEPERVRRSRPRPEDARLRASETIRAPEPETIRAPEPEPASRPRPPSVPSPPVSGRSGLPFTLEPSEGSLSGASLSRAVDGLRAVVAARQRAAETPARPAGARQPAFDEDLVAIPDVPVVMPTGDEWPQRVRAARVSVGRAWRSLALLPLIAVALFFLFRGDGGTEPLAPDGFHPAAGPPDAGSTASAARAEFERRRASLSESLASYNDRRAQLDLGTADCATLATVSRTAQHDFVRLSDLMAREETPLGASEREAWRHLVAETAAMAEHFRATGCEPGTGGP